MEESISSTEEGHDTVNSGLIFTTLVLFILTNIVNFLAGSGKGGVFKNTVGKISNKYELFITPAGFTFAIWGLIYLCLTISIIILVASVFVSTEFGRYVYFIINRRFSGSRHACSNF